MRLSGARADADADCAFAMRDAIAMPMRAMRCDTDLRARAQCVRCDAIAMRC
jgi:hypothetical protein